jgi:hypothetical protein
MIPAVNHNLDCLFFVDSRREMFASLSANC